MEEYNESNNSDFSGNMQPAVPQQEIGVKLDLPFLKNLTGWATFKAVIDIITGALACLGIITAVYGVPQIIAGVRLLNAIDDIKRYISSGDYEKIGPVFFNFHRYFKITGITIIIKIVFIILAIIGYIVIIALLVKNSPDFFNEFQYDFGNDFKIQ